MSERPAGVPPWLNKLMTFILRSPLHGLVSSKVMLITFKGRKSGRSYTTPVSYLQTDDNVTVFTHARWWKNCLGGRPVTMRIRGKDVAGTAEPVAEDKDAIAEALAEHLRHNHRDARYYGVTYDAEGNPNPDEVRRGAEDTVMLRIYMINKIPNTK